MIGILPVRPNDVHHVHPIEIERKNRNGKRPIHLNTSTTTFYSSHRRSSDSSNEDSTQVTSIDELIDLTARKKAEVERLAELERERMQLL